MNSNFPITALSERLITKICKAESFDFQLDCVFSFNKSLVKEKVLQITDGPLTGCILPRRICGDNAQLNVSGCSVSDTCPLTGVSLCVFCSASPTHTHTSPRRHIFFLFWGEFEQRCFLSSGAAAKVIRLSQKEADGRGRCTHADGFCFPRHTVSLTATTAAVSEGVSHQ